MPNPSLEQKLWEAADKLRGNVSSSDYKEVVLGLIFLKYISDSFEKKYNELKQSPIAEPEDRDEYMMENIYWVPKQARWSFIRDYAKQTSIGTIIDNAMDQIEKDNPDLKGVLFKNYATESLDKRRLGELIDIISTIDMSGPDKGDVLGQVYEYFLGKFAHAEGQRGGEFYTPKSVVKLLVEMIQPFNGRVYDPCCGSGGMFIQSEKFVLDHQGKIDSIHVYGQELNTTTMRLAKMNLAMHHIDAKLENGDTLHNDKHKDLKADFILANPPFNVSDWGQEHLRNDLRWKFGIPAKGNANYAWIQHFIHHLAPRGIAGFVLANGSMSSQTSGEGEIRQKIIEADLVDCIVSLPDKLFFNAAIPACLWFIARDRENRKGKTLFIDTRQMGTMINRRNRELSDTDIKKTADTYHNWRGSNGGKYDDVPGFCKVATAAEIAEQDYILTPGRYVGSEAVEDDDEAFEDKMKKLTTELNGQFIEGDKLEKEIKANLKKIGFEL
ncbi:MAG: class I SAM-dependent DNA methyltransferase [Candidatus Paceibacterota bacterium]